MLPNRVGNLQKGERYTPTYLLFYHYSHPRLDSNCNVDYVTMSALLHIPLELFCFLSYDIMCQWIIHLRKCITVLPPHLRLDLPNGEVRYVIPKYHFNSHKKEGHNKYSLNFKPGSAQTDGEQVKRG